MPMRNARTWRGTAGWCACALVALAGGVSVAVACMDYRPRPGGLARDAVSDDPVKAKAAIAALRARGPAGLEELMLPFGDVARPDENRPGVSDAARRRYAAAIDAVAGQKDAAYSGLYWHTNVEIAKLEAKMRGVPIVSLRLLGRLDEEFSCANSRFFRTVLYANREVADALRGRFVLHWQSVRPVPKVTIDMGDGRVIERTVTGNSIHYVLDAEGRTVDALPGLYGPTAFLRLLGEAEKIERELRALPPDRGDARATRLAGWHAARKLALESAWEGDLRALGVTLAAGALSAAPAGPASALPATPVVNTSNARVMAPPTALRAAERAMSKSVMELPLVRALDPVARGRALEGATADGTWAKIAALPAHAADARLDDNSRALVRAKREGASANVNRAGGPGAEDASRLSTAKMQQENPVLRLVRTFERSVAEDTVRNEYGFHRKLHEWFADRLPEAYAADGPDKLNDKVYAELFLTPGDDPWLGLAPADAYSALEGEGVRANAD